MSQFYQIARRDPARMRVVLIAAAVVAALLVGWWLTYRAHPAPPEAPAPSGSFKATGEQWGALTFARAAQVPFRDEIDTDGTIAAADTRTTQVFSPVSGRVIQVLAKAGDRVRAGQPLAMVEGVEFGQAAGDLAAAAAQLRQAQANAARLTDLYKSQGAALKDVEQGQTDLAAARNALQNAHSRLAGMGLAEAEIDQLAARTPGRARRFVIASPIAGVVTQQSVGPGQTVGSLAGGGASPLFVVADLSQVWLTGALREGDAALARLGQNVEARPTAWPDKVLRGRLDFISPVVDPVSRRVAVHATLANPEGVLRPQMFVSFALILNEGATALAVPAEAVIYEGEQARVWVADPATHLIRPRAIRAGRSANGRVEVLSGLAPGETVVVRGALFVDQAVKAG
jgi:membrane fusion protein, heavy metal efflux system